jgi:transposase
MGQVVTIGLDIAKSVFQVHVVDASGTTVLRQRLTRTKLPRCLVGIEACGTSHTGRGSWSRWGTR